MPQSPGTSASFLEFGAIAISQVLVPMIFTSVPGATPDPTAPRCASKAPTATGIPAGKPVFFAQAGVSVPTAWSIEWTRGVNRVHVGPLWGSPFGPSLGSDEQLSDSNPNGLRDGLVLVLSGSSNN